MVIEKKIIEKIGHLLIVLVIQAIKAINIINS